MRTALETSVLNQLNENLTNPDNWTGEGIVREYIEEAISLICLNNPFCTRNITIPLTGGTSIYILSPDNGNSSVIKIIQGYLRDQQRIITPINMSMLRSIDYRFLNTTGTPYHYCLLDNTKLLIYPHPATDTDAIVLKTACIPKEYDYARTHIEIPKEMYQYIVDFAQAQIYLSTNTRFEEGAKLLQQAMINFNIANSKIKNLYRYYKDNMKSVDNVSN